MQKVKKFRCPTCQKVYNSLATWTNHVKKQHPENIPPDMTPMQYFYFLQTGKSGNRCIICKSPTAWNEGTGKYERFCKNPKCRLEYREIFKKRMINKYGKSCLLDDPEQQRKMLEAKQNHSDYIFRDGTKIGYQSTYERDFLEMLNTFLHINGTDIMGPSPHTYYYNYKNPNDIEHEGKKFYIPDYFIPSLNLEIEIKQNTSTHPKILSIDKVKEAQKDDVMRRLPGTRYIKIVDKDYTNFFQLLLDLKTTMPIENPDKVNNVSVATEALTYPSHEIEQKLIEITRALEDADYGYHDGDKFTTDMSEFGWKYRTLTPTDFARYNGGVCWDYVNYQTEVFAKEFNIKSTSYYTEVLNDPAGIIHTHTFTTFSIGDKDYYLEGSLKKIAGLYTFDNISEVFSFILKAMCEDACVKHPKFNVYQYSAGKEFYGLNCVQFMEKVHKTGRRLTNVKYDPRGMIHRVGLTQVLESAMTNYDEPAMEGFLDFFKPKSDKEKSSILSMWKEKLFGSEASALVGGIPVTSKYVTFDKVLVDEKRGIISIQNIDLQKLIRRIRDTFGEKRLDYIFDRTYKSKDIQKYNKKRMSRSQMTITSLNTPIFFALELIIIFRELYNNYHYTSYAQIANLIYKKTWVSKADKDILSSLDKINLRRLETIDPKFTLKSYQREFIEQYPKLKAHLNLRGYYLSFDQGLGKTLTSSALAEVIEADHVYIVCPNTLCAVWKSELHDYFGDKYQSHICTGKNEPKNPENIKYFIVNNESIKNILPFIKLKGKSMLIVDEAHNFRNFTGNRVQELISLRESLTPRDILLLSGTPIKATPNEIVPSLLLLDPLFTNHAAEIYNSCFKFDSYMAMDIVKKRFGMLIYRKTKADVLVLPEKFIEDLRLPIKNPDPYFLKNVKAEVKDAFKVFYKELAKNDKAQSERFTTLIEKYSTAGVRKTNFYLSLVNRIVERDTDNFTSQNDFKHELDKEFFETFITTYIENSSNASPAEVKEVRELEKKFIRLRNSAMGKAVGAIYPHRRSNLFNSLFDENKTTFENMIRENKKKTVIFSQLLPVVKHITEELNKDGIRTVMIVGGMSDRMEVINKFRQDPDIDVIVATSQTMGTGVTLTEASQMFFFGPPWRSTDYDQCCDRIYRIGQDTDVHIFNVRLDSSENNLSDRMNKILDWSSQMFHSAIDPSDAEIALESMFTVVKDAIDEHYDQFKDVKNIVDRLNDRDLRYICGGEFKNSPHVIYRDIEYIKGDPAGFIDVYKLPKHHTRKEFPNHGDIVFAVKQRYRGKGIAQKLIRRMIKNFKINPELKDYTLVWTVDNDNLASIDLAKRNGFKLYKKNNQESIYLQDIPETKFAIEASHALENMINILNEEYDATEEEIAFESAGYSKTSKCPIFIILTKGHTPLSHIITKTTGDVWSHSSISFDIGLNPMYSFGTKKIDPAPQLGFVTTYAQDPLWGNKPTKYSVFVTFVNAIQLEKMKNRLKYFIENADRLKYDFIGLVRIFLGLKSKTQAKWFCSRFVADVINAGKSLSKDPSLQRPQTLERVEESEFLVSGDDIRKYDVRVAKKALNDIKKKELFPATEGIFFDKVEIRHSKNTDGSINSDDIEQHRIITVFSNDIDSVPEKIRKLPELKQYTTRYRNIICLDPIEVVTNASRNEIDSSIAKEICDVFGRGNYPDKTEHMANAIKWLYRCAMKYTEKHPEAFIVFMIDFPYMYYAVIDFPIAVIDFGLLPAVMRMKKRDNTTTLANFRALRETHRIMEMVDTSMKYAQKVFYNDSIRLFHISMENNLNELEARPTRSALKYENTAIPRISCASSIENCVTAVAKHPGIKKYYVYELLLDDDTEIYRPLQRYVPDVNATEEYWVTSKRIPIKKIGVLFLINKIQSGTSHWFSTPLMEEISKNVYARQYDFKKVAWIALEMCQEKDKDYDLFDIRVILLTKTKDWIGSVVVNLNTHEIKEFNIFDKYQRDGYGAELLKIAIDSFGANHIQAVYADNIPAISLYEKMGFVKNKSYSKPNPVTKKKENFISFKLPKKELYHNKLSPATEALLEKNSFEELIRKELTPEIIQQYKSKENMLIHCVDSKDINGAIFFDKDKVVAYIGLVHSRIVALWVHPRYRRQGYSQKLINIAINSYGADELFVRKDNLAAIDAYRKSGFKSTGTRNHMYIMKL